MARNRETLIVGIDIGSGNLRAVGAVRREGAKYPVVVGTFKKPLDGIDRGNIVDEQEIRGAIIDAIRSLEEQSGSSTLHTLISLGAVGLSSHHTSGYAQVSRGDASVTDLDIENAIKDGNRSIPDIRNKAIVHAIPMDHKVDGNKIQGSIIGVRGNKLETKTLFVTYPLQCMNVLKRTLDDADVRGSVHAIEEHRELIARRIGEKPHDDAFLEGDSDRIEGDGRAVNIRLAQSVVRSIR